MIGLLLTLAISADQETTPEIRSAIAPLIAQANAQRNAELRSLRAKIAAERTPARKAALRTELNNLAASDKLVELPTMHVSEMSKGKIGRIASVRNVGGAGVKVVEVIDGSIFVGDVAYGAIRDRASRGPFSVLFYGFDTESIPADKQFRIEDAVLGLGEQSYTPTSGRERKIIAVQRLDVESHLPAGYRLK